MIKKNVVISCVSLISISILLSGCAGLKKRAAETEARGTIENGGYTWKIQADSAGGNSIYTHGLPDRQAATNVSNQLCKKHGRVAQFVKQDGSILTGIRVFDFNCVK